MKFVRSKLVLSLVGFLFSSRRRHTRYWRDWSSDVCSSDLLWCRWIDLCKRLGTSFASSSASTLSWTWMSLTATGSASVGSPSGLQLITVCAVLSTAVHGADRG